jgi:hypothetical protein
VRKHCKKKISSKRRKHKIIIIGDSYGRGCAPKYDMDNAFEVQGVIKPGARLMTITNIAKEEVKNLTTMSW